MTTKDNGGGPAFPTERFDNELRDVPNGYHGMTLRDYFAVNCDQPGMSEIAVAAGLRVKSSHGFFVIREDGAEVTFDEWWNSLDQATRFALYAKVRYSLADALIAERSK
jgi:hypothetical protein